MKHPDDLERTQSEEAAHPACEWCGQPADRKAWVTPEAGAYKAEWYWVCSDECGNAIQNDLFPGVSYEGE